jgi:hypothetical protein
LRVQPIVIWSLGIGALDQSRCKEKGFVTNNPLYLFFFITLFLIETQPPKAILGNRRLNHQLPQMRKKTNLGTILD